MLQRLRAWAVADALPREHQKVRLVLVLAGLLAVLCGWIAVAVWGVPADMLDAGVRLEFAWWLWFFVGLSVALFLSGAPLIIFARHIRTLPASLLTGTALVAFIVYAFVFMVTSTSSTAALAIILPIFLNYFVVAIGVALDLLLRWLGGEALTLR